MDTEVKKHPPSAMQTTDAFLSLFIILLFYADTRTGSRSRMLCRKQTGLAHHLPQQIRAADHTDQFALVDHRNFFDALIREYFKKIAHILCNIHTDCFVIGQLHQRQLRQLCQPVIQRPGIIP